MVQVKGPAECWSQRKGSNIFIEMNRKKKTVTLDIVFWEGTQNAGPEKLL